MEKKIIYFLCTGNSCRSQIAEGYAKKFLSQKSEIFSAGVETHGLNPKAIEVMALDSINIQNQTSDLLDQQLLEKSYLVITLCGSALDRCPVIPKSCRHLHWDLEDPAKATGSPEEILHFFIKVREDIKNRILNLEKEL